MRALLKLNLAPGKDIEILTYNDSNTLYFFDEIEVIAHINQNNFILFKDFLCEGITAFRNMLLKAVDFELQIDPASIPHGLGYRWNIICYNIANIINADEEDTTSPYSLWHTTSEFLKSTWVYNIGKKIFIEISPDYKWIFLEPTPDDNYIEFNEFLNNYQVLEVIEVDSATVRQWVEECANIIEGLEK
ncbi:hypothetical protein HNQ56_000859 [Anaerotaenia torta]|uniref:hypothetical protein n=1 Tax=Anaerotaenia torta TaxID=433293 RepID=UPI003D208070